MRRPKRVASNYPFAFLVRLVRKNQEFLHEETLVAQRTDRGCGPFRDPSRTSTSNQRKQLSSEDRSGCEQRAWATGYSWQLEPVDIIGLGPGRQRCNCRRSRLQQVSVRYREIFKDRCGIDATHFFKRT